MKKRILSTLLAVVMLLGMIIMPATAAEGKMPFTDVKQGKWFYDAVEYVWKNDLMNGMTDTTFEPNTAMNRGMLVTVLWRVEGSPAPKGTTPFTDLKAKWYKDAVAWAYENEVVNGMTATTFAPANPITREQIATIIYRYAKFAGRDTSAKGDLSKFPDESKVAKYAKEAMTWAVGEGLISGTKVGDKDYLDPKGNATRAQVATILMRYLESGKDPMVGAFEDFLDTYLCPTHNTLHLTFQYGGDLTTENFGKLLLEVMELDTEKYEVVIDEDQFAEAHDSFAGQGDGFSGGGNIDVSIRNKETGEETETETINIYVKKEVGSGYNCLSYCPDDSDLDPEAEKVLEALYCEDASHGEGDHRMSHIIFNKESDYTEENVKKVILEASGLDDSFEVQLYSFNPDISAEETIEARIIRWTGKVIEISHQFYYIPSINESAKDGGEITKEHQATDPMHKAFEEFLDTYLCVTHGALTTMHKGGSNYNAANLAALVLDTMGLDAETYSVVINGDISDPGVGIGQFCGAGGVEIYVKNNVTGEETEHETISVSSRKLNHVEYDGTICLYTCPEDSVVWKPAEEILDRYVCTDDSHEDPIIHALFPDEASFTEENFVALIAAELGAVEGHQIQVTKFDPARLNTDSTCRVYVYKWNDNVLEATNEISFICSTADVDAPTLSAEHFVPKTLEDFIDERIAELACAAHHDVNLQFGTGSTVTPETLSALLTEIFGYKAEVASDDAYAGARGAYGDEGDGSTVAFDVNVTFTDEESGETCTKLVELAIRKDLLAKYSGAVEYGALSVCPDELPDDIKAAQEAIGALPGEITLEGKVFNETVIENWYREVTGLTGGEWEFFMANFDAEAAYSGNEVIVVLKNVNVNDEGRTYTVGAEKVLKIDTEAVDPMHAKFEAFLDEYLCVTHGALTTMHKGGGNYNAANLGALVISTMGLDPTIYSAVINGDISDPGVGIGQFCGAGNVEIYIVNNVTGEETEHETINTSSRKLNHVAYDGTICLYTCPEDSEMWKPAEEILGGLICADDSHGDPTIHALFPNVADITQDNLATAVLAALDGIEGAEVGFSWFEDGYAGVYLTKWNGNVLEATNVFEVVSSVSASVDAPVLSAEHPVPDPMHVTFEEFLDEYLCVTHGALTTMHKGGGNYNASNLAALVLDTMGLDAETYSVVINGDISDPGVGIGQFCGASNVEIYVKNNTTGEETEHQTINTSSRKLNHVAYDGVICFYTCPEDSEMWKPAEETLGGFICADDSHEDPTIHALFPDADSITEDNLAAAVLAALEGIEGAEVGFAWYEDGYAGVYLVKWNENVLEATNVFEIVSSVDESVDAPVLSTEHPVPVVPPAPPTYMDIDYDVATDKQGDLINDGAAFNAWVLEYITSRFEFPQDSIEINNYSALKSAYDDMMASGDYSAATTISLTYHSSDASAAAVDATYNFYFVGGPYVEATSGDGPALPAMTCDIEFNVRHVEPSNVAKDGVISEGEYYRCLAPKAELFGAKTMTGDKLTKYQQMVDTSKFYFSWDEEHGFNIAVEMIAPDLLQLNSADVFDGRLEPKEGDDPDNFVGPCDGFMDQLAFVFQGVADASGAHGFYYAFGRNTETGEYLRGHWFGSMLDGLPQYGYNASYYPVEDQDMVISYGPGNKVVFEYSLPLTTLFPAEMINSDGTIVNGSKYNYNMTITNGWNETTHTIANSASDYNAEMVPLKFGDLGAWLDWRQGKWNGKTVKRFNRPAVLTFINEG